ncbi:MAG: hypothetical protein WBI40_10880 [Methylococcaceae bacterium]
MSDNTVWFDIGEMDYDKYEDQQQVLKEFNLPAFNRDIVLVLPSVNIDEDIPF